MSAVVFKGVSKAGKLVASTSRNLGEVEFRKETAPDVLNKSSKFQSRRVQMAFIF
jgi:hypothetical protein